MNNCFTFSPLVGLTPGIALTVDSPTLRNDGSLHPPHVKIGPEFIMVDKVKTPSFKNAVLHNAAIREVTPATGKSFSTLARADGATSMLVFIDLFVVPTHVRYRKFDPSFVQAWVYFDTDGVIVRNHNASGQALIEFTKNEQSALIFDRDGGVHRIVRRSGTMQVVPLSFKEMAQERIDLMNNQINELGDIESDGYRKRDAILAGAVRLLRVASADASIRGMLVDFLIEYADGRMGGGIRDQVQLLLRDIGDMRACMFDEGYDNNVVLFSNPKPKSATRGQKLAERRERDQQIRAAMRGSSNGSKQGRKKP